VNGTQSPDRHRVVVFMAASINKKNSHPTRGESDAHAVPPDLSQT
jgi:hypothetical protein